MIHGGSKTNGKRGNRRNYLQGGRFTHISWIPCFSILTLDREQKRRKQKERKRPSIILRLTCLRSYRGSTLQQINTTSPIITKTLVHIHSEREVYLFSHHSWLAHSARHAWGPCHTKQNWVSFIHNARKAVSSTCRLLPLQWWDYRLPSMLSVYMQSYFIKLKCHIVQLFSWLRRLWLQWLRMNISNESKLKWLPWSLESLCWVPLVRCTHEAK